MKVYLVYSREDSMSELWEVIAVCETKESARKLIIEDLMSEQGAFDGELSDCVAELDKTNRIHREDFGYHICPVNTDEIM